MAADIVLEVKNIEKSFGTNKSIRGVSFELRAGEVHAIVGEKWRRKINADEYYRRSINSGCGRNLY